MPDDIGRPLGPAEADFRPEAGHLAGGSRRGGVDGNYVLPAKVGEGVYVERPGRKQWTCERIPFCIEQAARRSCRTSTEGLTLGADLHRGLDRGSPEGRARQPSPPEADVAEADPLRGAGRPAPCRRPKSTVRS